VLALSNDRELEARDPKLKVSDMSLFSQRTVPT
jgi:hypothetical protein